MVLSVIWILAGGFLGAKLADRLGLPPLLGMIGVGIFLGVSGIQAIGPELLAYSDQLRSLAVMIILMKAGLGLDWQKLSHQGTVALRLGVLPGLAEALVIALLSVVIFQFDWLTGLLLGCIIGAESPAVIVPGMLKLKSQGWGVKKGIPDAILTGSALSDVFLLLAFSLVLNIIEGQRQGLALGWQGLWQLPLGVVGQMVIGVALGYGAARLIIWLAVARNLTRTTTETTLMAVAIALFLVEMAHQWPHYSGYLAVMALGFFLLQLDPPLARPLRLSFDHLWTVGQIFLFVLLGAEIPLATLGHLLVPGAILLTLGLVLGRSWGWALSTWGSDWQWRERLFLAPGNSAKATVQAAIGAIPLGMGLPHGEEILAIAALAILFTAPLGAWAIPRCAPLLLEKGEVDPTKIAMAHQGKWLVAVDASPGAVSLLKAAATQVRASNGELVVLHVVNHTESFELEWLHRQAATHLTDLRYQFQAIEGTIPETILTVAQDHQVTGIIMGKTPTPAVGLMGSVSQTVLETSAIPVTIMAIAPEHP